MSLKEAISKRRSTRTYLKESFGLTETNEISAVILKNQSVVGPFDHSFDLTFNINDEKVVDGKKISTYGLLKNVPSFIGGVSDNTFESLVDFGYIFERTILDLTTLGYDTCWLGGTFKRKHYFQELKDNRIIPAISPVGHKAKKRSLVDRTIRNVAQSTTRLPLNELFKDIEDRPIISNISYPIIDSLSLVRVAPSASNKQPWRAIVDEKRKSIHFYLLRNEGYGETLKYDIQALDIGIALCHFEIGLESHHMKYRQVVQDDYPIYSEAQYVISYKLGK